MSIDTSAHAAASAVISHATGGPALSRPFIPAIPTRDGRWPLADAIGHWVTRGFEIMFALVCLIVASPIMLMIALIIRLDSPGPALFRQIRVGANGRLFWFYKYRTLYADAKTRFPELYAYDYSADELLTLRFKHEEDPRITPVGTWLRKSTLDELPNFCNVLKGDIGIVGPRPEIPEMVKHYSAEQLLKFSIRPGITGLAQTHGRGHLGFQETIAWDLTYVRERSVWLDIKIIFRTLRMLMTPDGAF